MTTGLIGLIMIRLVPSDALCSGTEDDDADSQEEEDIGDDLYGQREDGDELYDDNGNVKDEFVMEPAGEFPMV